MKNANISITNGSINSWQPGSDRGDRVASISSLARRNPMDGWGGIKDFVENIEMGIAGKVVVRSRCGRERICSP